MFALAGLSYIITFFSVQYTGEEAIYTVMSYEMRYHGLVLTPTMFGESYTRPPLYATDVGWVGIAVIAQIDLAIAPKPPLVMAPHDLKNGFLIAEEPYPEMGRLFRSYHNLYLMCKGDSCDGAGTSR